MNNCKICGKRLDNIINELFLCPTEDDKDHTYTMSFSREKLSTEEFRVIDNASNRSYIVWVCHFDKETHLKIAVGNKVIQSKVLKNTLLKLDLTTEASLIEKIQKLMVLF